MGAVGDGYDNAMRESFVATLECELLERRRFGSQVEARMAVFDSWLQLTDQLPEHEHPLRESA